MSAPTLVDVAGVSFGYHARGERVLEDVSCTLEAGEILGVSGSSGSGKSTLLRLIAGLLQPQAGAVRLAPPGADALAYAPQDDILLDYRSVFENAALLLERAEDRAGPPPAALERATAVLTSLKLGRHRDALPTTLSGGMRQRVQVAQALASGALLLLFDEPFAHQDRDNQRVMETIIVETASEGGRGAVVISHDIDSLAAICTRTLFLAGAPGRVASTLEAPPEMRPLGAEARRAHPAFAAFNEALWTSRAEASLL